MNNELDIARLFLSVYKRTNSKMEFLEEINRYNYLPYSILNCNVIYDLIREVEQAVHAEVEIIEGEFQKIRKKSRQELWESDRKKARKALWENEK